MRVAVAADHAGYALKERLGEHLASRGHEVLDLGAHDVLALGARVVGDALALEIADAFPAARFDGAERHRRRVDELRALEARFTGGRQRGQSTP